MKYKIVLLFILGVDIYVLLNEISDLSITYHEATVLYESHSLTHYITNLSIALFGNNDLGLRFPSIFFHVLSTILLYKISSKYSTKESDRLWLVFIYVLLPGINSAAILVDSSSLVIFMLFLFSYVWIYKRALTPYLMFLYLFIDQSFIWLYISLSIYLLINKKFIYALYSLLLSIAAYCMYGFNLGGTPKGYVLDELAIYAAIFSPIIFIYVVYSLYRYFVLKKLNILWYLSVIPFLISVVLSFRQRLELQFFAPYMMLALPLTMQMFFHSYRVRLKEYRYKYKIAFILAFMILLINIVAIFMNEKLYMYIKNPSTHFAYRSHVAKDLSQALKRDDIWCINANDEKMQLRLRYYGINKCDTYQMSEFFTQGSKKVTISYINKDIYTAYVSKIHKNSYEKAIE